MAANDEFPRGLTQTSAPAFGAVASVTFPAVPGISWVLTNVDATVYSNVASTGYAEDAAINGAPVSIMVISNGSPAPSDGSLSPSFKGPQAFPPGTAVTVALSGNAPGYAQILQATAYPI